MIGNLKAEVRSDKGKGAAHRLRREGKVPAVIYAGGESQLLALDALQIQHLLEKSAHVVNLDIEGETREERQALIKEVQLHPVHIHRILHVDLHEIRKGTKVEVTVPLRARGQPVGLAKGGRLGMELRDLDIRSLPRLIPEEVVVDVSALDFGDQFLVENLELPEGVEAMTDGSTLIAHVIAPRGGLGEEAEAEAAEGAEEAGEVEVIGKGKQEEEEAGE